MIVRCQQCGKNLEARTYEVSRGRGRFCSRTCASTSLRVPAEDRFWRYVAKRAPDDCWEWIGAKIPNGYGVLYLSERHTNVGAHRFSYWLHYGIWPEKLCVCHHCDNPGCVNPAHLFLGTNLDNKRDSLAKGRVAHGDILRHPESRLRGSANRNAKLVESDIVEIRQLFAAGNTSMSQLAIQYKVVKSCIRLIIRGKTWRHVPMP